MLEAFLLVSTIFMFALTSVLAFSNARLWIELKAMQKSTHQIQWMDPAEVLKKELTQDEEEALSADPLNSII